MIRGTGTVQGIRGGQYAQLYVPQKVDEALPLVPGDTYTAEVVDPALVFTPGDLRWRVEALSLEPINGGQPHE